MRKMALMAVAFTTLAPVPALAGPLDEVRVGVMAHNTLLLESKNANKEASLNLVGEVVFVSPEFLSWALKPRPYVAASINTGGDTSFIAAGLEWRARLSATWAFEPGLGYALHDGTTNNPFRNGDPRGTAFVRDKVLLGSEDLFRVSFAFMREMGPNWRAGVLWEHYSHGQILGEGRNQGIDEVGIRLARKLGD
jgi:lipid A 3-O-deacylase